MDSKKKKRIFIGSGIALSLVVILVLVLFLPKCSTHTHSYADPTYTWSDNYSTCTALRVCTNDSSHTETETVDSTYAVVTAATCTEDGVGRYTATFTNSAFSTQTYDITLDAIGHDYGEPVYIWSNDNSTCTASMTCKNDSSHVVSETVDSTYAVMTAATNDDYGVGRYTATFTNTAFEAQTKTVQIAKYNGETPIVDTDAKTITYGLYPQTVVDNSSLLTALDALKTAESNGWYYYDGNYYAKIIATPYGTSYVFDNGTTIESETTYWFKCEPITWNVLSNNDGEYYLLSSVLLDAQCYYNSISDRTIDDNTIYANNYEYSDIRTWLNGDFYNSAFALNNSYIQTTTVDNSASTTDSTSNSYACSNTSDKVFLPSYKDYCNSSYGFSTSIDSSSTRYCKTTDWARARGAYYYASPSYLYNGIYWTRSPSSDFSYYAWDVDYDGYLNGEFDVLDPNYGVRPALIVNL